jgi:CubicO group peptidase (beta-lactamase class C family)
LNNYAQQLGSALASTGVTGASFAYWDGTTLHTAVAGLRNSVTADPVTIDTILHIGSITKVFNAALMMQLVDEGKIALNDPVVNHLPGLRLRDMEALKRITCAMLLNHTSGINCSMLPDHGPDQERIEDAVARCADLGQLHAPGEATSYCNMGTVIAGYLTQTLRGESWYGLIKTRIFEPLGMRHAVANLTELPRFRSSVGDLTDLKTGKLVQTTQPFLPLSFAPAGTTVMMSATDLVTFGRAMINGGVGPTGARILSDSSASLMTKPTAALVLPVGRHVGLGWMILPGGVLNHSGGGPGVYSQLCAHPPSGRVLALLRNCDKGPSLDAVITNPIVDSWTGIKSPALPPRQSGSFDPKPYEGVYELSPLRAEVLARDAGLVLRFSWGARIYDNSVLADEAPAILLHPLGDHAFEVEGAILPQVATTEVRFVPGPDGRMRFFAPLAAHLLARVK